MMRLAPPSASDLARGLDDQVQLIDTFFHGEPEDSLTRARGQRGKIDIDRFRTSAVKPQCGDPKRADSRKCRITAKPNGKFAANGKNVLTAPKFNFRRAEIFIIKIFDWKSAGFFAICEKPPEGNGSAISYGQPSRITTGRIWRFDERQRRCSRMTIFLLVIGDIVRFGQNPAFSLVKTCDLEMESDVLKSMISQS
jgi:hypothetical protein